MPDNTCQQALGRVGNQDAPQLATSHCCFRAPYSENLASTRPTVHELGVELEKFLACTTSKVSTLVLLGPTMFTRLLMEACHYTYIILQALQRVSKPARAPAEPRTGYRIE
jgi:hypothetical protein